MIDDRASLDAATGALAGAGIGADAVVIVHGPDDLARSRGGAWNRAMRFLSFIAVDQAVDLAWYEAALAGGRSVLLLRVPRHEDRRAVVAALRWSRSS